ncbi:Trihelix transcription factor GT-2 [Linum grandiflorum]
MLGDSASGGGGGATTANPHYQVQHQHQQQQHHNPSSNPPINSPAQFSAPPPESGQHVGSSSGGEEDRFGGGSGGNRWPRQETVALLRIRTDMDATFRDASVKGPLWDDVSRKMAELGYHRSSKKCKEKFENVYKYHKRTKDGRTAKHDGKTYRFFQELEAFDTHPSPAGPPPPQQHHKPVVQLQIPAVNPPPAPPAPLQQHKPAVQLQIPAVNPPPPPQPPPTTVPSTAAVLPPHTPSAINTAIATSTAAAAAAAATVFPPQSTNQQQTQQQYPPSFSDLMSNSNSTSSSTSTSSEAEIQGVRDGRNKRKRKWQDLFERLMTEVVNKQEEMQRKFLEAIEKREKERISREDYWRNQEMARINREREILAQERSIAASKDAAVMSFLQKISDQHQIPIPIPTTAPPPAAPPPPPQQQPVQIPQVIQATPPQPPPQPQPQAQQPPPPHTPSTMTALAPLPQQSTAETEHQVRNQPQSENVSSSRWPKVEIEALIDLRKNLDSKYQENGPKGPLWEEISARMKRIGYNRSAKRCKEKWENINKYFKKVKESNKKRPEDSKTCPYFHQLDALYRERQSNSVPILVQPEQQWPPQQPAAVSQQQPAATGPPPQHPVHQLHRPDAVMEDMESEEDENDDDDDEEGDDDHDGGGGGYELVSNKATSMNM